MREEIYNSPGEASLRRSLLTSEQTNRSDTIISPLFLAIFLGQCATGFHVSKHLITFAVVYLVTFAILALFYHHAKKSPKFQKKHTPQLDLCANAEFAWLEKSNRRVWQFAWTDYAGLFHLTGGAYEIIGAQGQRLGRIGSRGAKILGEYAKEVGAPSLPEVIQNVEAERRKTLLRRGYWLSPAGIAIIGACWLPFRNILLIPDNLGAFLFITGFLGLVVTLFGINDITVANIERR